MAGQTGSISGGPKEALRRADLLPARDSTPLVLPNPSEATITWALLHQPYENIPRWGATLEQEQRGTSDGVFTEAVVRQDIFNGHLKVSRLSVKHSIPELVIPGREVEIALGKRKSDMIVFPDSGGTSREGDGYEEFTQAWLPVLWREGYKVRDARLVNLFEGRDIYDDHVLIKSGVDITQEAIIMYPLDDKGETERAPFLLDGDKAREWFAKLEQVETKEQRIRRGGELLGQKLVESAFGHPEHELPDDYIA
jgi:hypothetical protein